MSPERKLLNQHAAAAAVTVLAWLAFIVAVLVKLLK